MLLRPCDQTQSTINYENIDRLNIKQVRERWFRSNQHDLSKSLRLLFALRLLSCTLRKNVFAPHKREIDLYFTFHASSFAERICSISRCNTIVWRIIVCTTLSRLCIRFARVNQWLVRPRIFSPCRAGYSYACKANAENKTNHAMTQNLSIFCLDC